MPSTTDIALVGGYTAVVIGAFGAHKTGDRIWFVPLAVGMAIAMTAAILGGV